ncbi:MAG: multidrug efflux pump subunit AcrA (membrane-fusion protein) [Paracoccaceae bacterium]|jgi:multidrug efflux pump subunit AcrA (membrane-fusion protein)
MNNFLKLILVTGPIIGLGAGFLAYTVSNRLPPDQNVLAERVTHVSVVRARPQAIKPRISGFGRAEPARIYEVVAQVAGTADYVNPKLNRGEILPAGSVLVRLSPADFNLAIAQSRSTIRTAEARLEELTVAQDNFESSLAIEKETLALKQRELERSETLLRTGSVPQSTRDGVLASVLAQLQRVQNVEGSIALLPTQRAVQIEQISAAKISLDQAELNLARTELTLPYAARVSLVEVETGEFVRAGNTIAKLDGVDAAEVEAQINLASLRGLLHLAVPSGGPLPMDPSEMTEVIRNLDLQVTVNLTLGGDVVSWNATVDRLSDTIDPRTGAVGVVVRVDDAYSTSFPGNRPPLTQGMFVEVVLTAPPLNGLVLPRTALRDGKILLADKENRLRAVKIIPRLIQGDIVVVTEGLEAGVSVLVVPPTPAIEGMLLQTHLDEARMVELANEGSSE